MTFVLSRATTDDIPFIMACERRPGYESVVGRWPEDKHRTAMADTTIRYFVGHDAQAPRGFAIIFDDRFHPDNLFLKRVAVHDAGAGHGNALLTALHDWAFAEADTHRLWLEVFEHNLQARRAYERLGYVVEGIAREAHAGAHGERLSLVQMSLLKPEWLSRKA